ncbi:MipA/OmpV family protein [Thalassotalea sp. ND16A]|uniref:MipA/OmpV family protein n=1 Tax=Thalassotalea sp. ND16A TaxID=1535422 RepID=UPI00051A09FE|nr:MipA/OmpV family protein [Thalassotalea sp. ND16A]
MSFISFVLVSLFFSFSLAANSDNDIYQEDEGLHLGIGAGYGRMGNPVYHMDDIPLILIPRIEYFYGDFAFSNTQLTYTPFYGENFQFSFLTRFNNDGLYFLEQNFSTSLAAATFRSPMMGSPSPGQIPPKGTVPTKRRGDMSLIQRRHLSLMSGVEWIYDWQYWRLSASWLQEITQRHYGGEKFLAVERHWLLDKHLVVLGAEVQQQSADLIDYYYGSHYSDLGAGFSQYKGEQAYNFSLQLKYQYRFDNKWQLITDLKYQTLDPVISESPFVDQSNVFSFYAGIAWNH